MNEHPILFTPEHVRAIIDGRKTQTRRVVRGTQPSDPIDQWIAAGQVIRCPYGGPGDLLWVREAWAAPDTIMGAINYLAIATGSPVVYKADGGAFPERYNLGYHKSWRSPMFMPRWAARLTLRITEVRVERVQEIGDDDARAEGVRLPERTVTLYNGIYIDAYAWVWDAINAKRGYSWASNPWVWAITFEVV